jgi:hypothetical protein
MQKDENKEGLKIAKEPRKVYSACHLNCWDILRNSEDVRGGLNTGVVIYNLQRMRLSKEYQVSVSWLNMKN